MLLSQGLQAALGFVKDSRTGEIILKDYDGQSVEVVRQIRTGLFMVRIDHVFKKDFITLSPKIRKLMLDYDPEQVAFSPAESFSPTEEHAAFVGSQPTPVTSKFPPKLMNAETIIVS